MVPSDSRRRPRATAVLAGAALAAACVVILGGPSAGCGGDAGTTTDSETGTGRPRGGSGGSSGGSAGTSHAGAAGNGNASGNGTGGATPTSTATGTTPPPGTLNCGDGVCVHDEDEVCETCPQDCGACPVCGNGACEKASGLESCESCEQDCGACSTCGDGACSAESGEDCTTCVADCGACQTCGNGACDETETCDSCQADCGACKTCGNGTCDAGESCQNCEDDCGECDTCGDDKCSADEDCKSCAKDCGACQRTGCIQGGFQAYWGGLHAHTHVSDGEGSPAQAFAHAKNVAKPPLDFLWLSDHHNGITPAEWKGCVTAADKYNETNIFAAGCGYEKTIFNDKNAGIGHFNTLFPDKLLKLSYNIPGIYNAIGDCGPCLGQFNHPPWPGTFQNYKYYGAAKDKVRLIEFNGHGSFPDKLGAYFTALDNGWFVSPSWNEDNHHRGWGDTSNATLIWAPKLTRAAVRTAVRENRTAATNDDTARMKVVADGACWMGSKLHGFGKTTLTVTLYDKQAKDGFGVITLYGPKQKKLATFDCKGKNPCETTFNRTVDAATHFVVVARQQDDDVIIGAPIWYQK
jgi:hypothetical protein